MEGSFVGFLYVIVGMLIGGLATHFLSKDIYRRNDFNQAAKEFTSAFQSELTRLKSDPTSTYEIIKPALLNHLDACSNFRRFLKGRELDKFDRARKIYYLSTPPCPNNEDDTKYQDERTALIERIEELRDFAKRK